MECPKCGAAEQDGQAICTACGLVFEKYWKYHPRPGDEAAADRIASPPVAGRRLAGRLPSRAGTGGGRGPLAELLLPTPKAEPPAAWARAVLFAVLVVWGLWFITSSVASNAVGESFLHLVNLPFHEAGHVFFGIFGQFIGSLGGTLGQLLMPLTAMLVLLLKTRDPFGASVALWWLGQNFLDIAPYINDARAGELPLLGGNFGHSAPYGFHDWEYLLTETGLIRMDHQIAQGSHLLGSLIMLVAMLWGGVLVYRQLAAGR
ncbi:TFIIB-type zinc ribbon-containing protein [Thiohalocapsa halophila]